MGIANRVLIAAAVLVFACARPLPLHRLSEMPPAPALPDAPSPVDFASVDTLMLAGIADSTFPGAVLLIGLEGRIIYHKAFGRMGYGGYALPIPPDAIFDLASLTKVVATTTATMLLVDRKQLRLEDPIQKYLPDFSGGGREQIKIGNLLTHTAGLVPFKEYFLDSLSSDDMWERIYTEPLIYTPGDTTRYSDHGMMLLMQIIEAVSGQSFDAFCQEKIFAPLSMHRTAFVPGPDNWASIMPTEADPWRGYLVQGEVHDRNAYSVGGVSGHAGLFSTPRDVAQLIQMLLQEGRAGETRYLSKGIINNFTRKQERVAGSTRALGWDTRSQQGSSSGEFLSMRAFGHTGYTGTSVWADPERNLFVLLFSNRVHPTRNNRKIYAFRPRLHNQVMLSLYPGLQAGQSEVSP